MATIVSADTYTVRILDRTTGVVAEYCMDQPWNDGSFYLWSEGNYECDCSRERFFWRAIAAESDEYPDEALCSGERFAVLSITLSTGEIVYAEGRDRKPLKGFE